MYLERSPRKYIDALLGPPEILLFNAERVITKIDLSEKEEGPTFSWVSKKTCMDDLGKGIHVDMFVDACLLAGTSLLPTFSPLETSQTQHNPSKAITPRDSLNMILTLGRSVTSVCTHFAGELQAQQMDYLDRYRRVRMAIKHHIVMTEDGQLEPLDAQNAPGDIHEFIGQRLPDEVYFYLSKGTIGPRVLNWFASGEILELPPLTGGETPEYKRLITNQLINIRSQSLSLLSQRLHRFYQLKKVSVKVWYDENTSVTIKPADLQSQTYNNTLSWNVKEFLIGEAHKRIKVNVFAIEVDWF